MPVRQGVADAGVGILHLSRSFRSVAGIQNAVNAAFRLRMTDDERAGQPEYVALEPHVRRLWPDLIISWTRLLAGRYRIVDRIVEVENPRLRQYAGGFSYYWRSKQNARAPLASASPAPKRRVSRG